MRRALTVMVGLIGALLFPVWYHNTHHLRIWTISVYIHDTRYLLYFIKLNYIEHHQTVEVKLFSLQLLFVFNLRCNLLLNVYIPFSYILLSRNVKWI